MRVIGSQAISTRPSPLPARSVVVIVPPLPVRAVAGGQLATGLAPLGLLVDRLGGDVAQAADHRPVHAAGRRRHLAAGRLVHERHELVREPGHGAADADAAHVGAAADAVEPAPLGHVALDHRPPAADLDQALGGAVLGGEVALLVVAGPVAALVHGHAEQPGGPQGLVQGDHRGLAGRLVEQVQDRLGEVVALDGAAGHTHDRDAGLGLPAPAQVVGDAHGPGGVAGHGVDAAVGGAGADGQHGQGLGGQAVDPLAGGHGLAGVGVVAEAAPVALALDRLVGDRALDDQHV